MGVVLTQLHTKPTRLNPDSGITLRVEARWTTQNFGRNLVFLERDSGVIERVF